MKTLLSILFIATIVFSCNETKQVMGTGNQVQLSGTYTVIAIDGEDIYDNAPTLIFDLKEKRLSGSTGCNRYFGGFTHDLNALEILDIASTEMACEQPIMDVENRFLQALRNTGSYSLNDGVLLLFSKMDKSVLLTAKKNRIPQETGE